MRRLVVTFAFLCLLQRLLMGVETLVFDASQTPNVTYQLRWVATNDPLSQSSLDLGTNRVVALTNGPFGSFQFHVVARTSNLVDSPPSNVLLATNRPEGPLRLRIGETTNQAVQIELYFNGKWQMAQIYTNNHPPNVALTPAQSAMIRARFIKPPPFPQ